MTMAPKRKGTGETGESYTVGELLVADLCTHLPFSVDNQTNMLYIQDVATRLQWAFPLGSKIPEGVGQRLNEVVDEIAEYRKFSGLPPLRTWKLHTDQGGEFDGNVIQERITPLGGVWVPAVPGRHVALAEVGIRHTVDGIRALIESSGLFVKYWAHAARHWCWLKRLEDEEYMAFKGFQGYDIQPRAFGNLCFANVPKARVKGEPKGRPCAYLGTGKSRRSATLIYMDDKEKFRHFECEYGDQPENERVLYFEEPFPDGAPTMAFKRVYRDLKPLSVLNTAASRSGYPGMTKEEFERWLVLHPGRAVCTVNFSLILEML